MVGVNALTSPQSASGMTFINTPQLHGTWLPNERKGPRVVGAACCLLGGNKGISIWKAELQTHNYKQRLVVEDWARGPSIRFAVFVLRTSLLLTSMSALVVET
jgi:hypothetical protein